MSILRSFVVSLLALTMASPAFPQTGGPPAPTPFRYEDVVRRARDLSSMPFEGGVPALPEPLAKLDFDGYRDIRFKPDKAFLAQASTPFRAQLFHLGFLYSRPVTVNIVRDGVATPIPYQPQLFDYGRTRLDKPLPINFGFAGFRLHYPLNEPKVFDELVSFLGASYFRFLGRGQRYGLSARGLALNVDSKNEEFPFFREFWIETPLPNADRVTVHALLDSVSVTGAYRFQFLPGAQTAVDVTVTLYPRRTLTSLGLAPLTSMFFVGENDRKFVDDFRPELHDSDGLALHSGAGEWIWRPLQNPHETRVSSFLDVNPRGFGLMQRDQVFENYQDLEAFYHQRPSYWVEPLGNWGEGQVQLLELPTRDETHDNIVASWQPKQPLEAGQEAVFSYRMRAMSAADELHGGAKVVNTYQSRAHASGSHEPRDISVRRFIIDFAGGDLAYYLSDPDQVQVVPSTSLGTILSTFILPNEHTSGFRAAIDVRLEPGQSTDLRAYLKAGNKALTETWTMPWKAE